MSCTTRGLGACPPHLPPEINTKKECNLVPSGAYFAITMVYSSEKYSLKMPILGKNNVNICVFFRKRDTSWNILAEASERCAPLVTYLQRPPEVMHHLAHIHWALRIYYSFCTYF